MKAIHRAVFGAVGLFALGLQYWLLAANDPEGVGLAGWTIRYFSYFTILSNIMVALALLVPLVAPRSAAGAFLDRPTVRTAIITYILIVGAVYVLILQKLWAPQGWFRVADYLLHYVMPLAFAADWLLFVAKGRVPWRNGLVALILPVAYLAWTLAHGAASGWYPYPFFDVAELGYGGVLANAATLTGVFLGLGLLLTAIDRLLGRLRPVPTGA